LKADTTGAELSLEDTRSIIDNRGKSELQQLNDEREILLSNIDTSDDLDELASDQRQLGVVEARIAKLNHISMSDEDGRQISKAGFNKQMAELQDLETKNAELA